MSVHICLYICTNHWKCNSNYTTCIIQPGALYIYLFFSWFEMWWPILSYRVPSSSSSLLTSEETSSSAASRTQKAWKHMFWKHGLPLNPSSLCVNGGSSENVILFRSLFSPSVKWEYSQVIALSIMWMFSDIVGLKFWSSYLAYINYITNAMNTTGL